MSALSITKNYADSTLLLTSDIHGMWTELETKTNGNIDDDNVVSGFTSWSNVTLAKDTLFTMGATGSSYFYYRDTQDELVFSFLTTQRSVLFKLGGTTKVDFDSNSDMNIKTDVFFFNRSAVYGLASLIGYQKPVLVYEDSTTVRVEQNTTTANRTLITFPTGPIAVTEDVTATNKFRKLKLDAVANGYSSSHTGAADSGMKSGLSLTANTWYFVYAVVVQGGDDAAADNFILVVDDTSPVHTNWSTLDTRYTSGMWIYLGPLRYGHGESNTEELVPFVQDHTGWITFTGRADTDDFFGIKVANAGITSTSYATMETFAPASSGDAAPANCSHMRISYRPVADGAEMNGNIILTDGSDNVLWDLPSFAVNLAVEDAHGWSVKIPNVSSIKIKGKTGV
jgi:hypothetical protein